MFSPYYAWQRRCREAEPRNHVAMNVAIYGANAKRWAMTERSAAALDYSTHELSIGPSAMRWTNGTLDIRFDEVAFPFLARVCGHVKLTPTVLPQTENDLTPDGRHIWRPIAPIARAEVTLTHPDLRFSGHAYFDHNRGTEPMERAFRSWNWSRQSGDSETRILYDAILDDGTSRDLAVRFSHDGREGIFASPPQANLPRGPIWRMPRATRSDAGTRAQVVRTLEDTPFYTRSLIAHSLDGVAGTSFHESLDLRRFRTPIVQAMLPFRMPRRA